MRKYDRSLPSTAAVLTKYVIVVPSKEDKRELMEAFEHIHYSNVDNDYVVVNQLIHEYMDSSRSEGAVNSIVVDPLVYEELNKQRK